MWDNAAMNKPKHLGYQHWFELYLMQDIYNQKAWDKTLLAFAQYIGFYELISL